MIPSLEIREDASATNCAMELIIAPKFCGKTRMTVGT
jgi:hypothetical protein